MGVLRRLEKNRGCDGVVASPGHELNRAMEVGVASGELFCQRERISGLDEHVETPAFDLRSLRLVLHLDGLSLAHERLLFVGPLVRSPSDEPSLGKLEEKRMPSGVASGRAEPDLGF